MTSSSFAKLDVRRKPRPTTITDAASSTATLFWKRFKSPITLQETSAVTQVRCHAHQVAMATGARVNIVSGKNGVTKKTIARFKENVNGIGWRQDGKLIAAGDGSGLVQVFDVGSRAILRSLRGHQGPVHVVDFINSTQILTCSDDQTVRVWDLPTEAAIHTLSNFHDDYVRAGATFHSSPHMIITGGYDHQINLFDLRQSSISKPAIQYAPLNHPIESLVVFPGDALFAVASGPCAIVYDVMTGREIGRVEGFQKTVTSVGVVELPSVDASGAEGCLNLVCSGLDSVVKMYDLSKTGAVAAEEEDENSVWPMVHAFRYPAPVLSCSVSLDVTTLAVGMTEGVAEIRMRKQAAQSESVPLLAADSVSRVPGIKNAYARPGYVPMTNTKSKSDEFNVVKGRERMKKLSKFEKELKHFNYDIALDLALDQNNPGVTVALLEELHFRNGIEQAIARRDDRGLMPLLKFIHEYMRDPFYTATLARTMDAILDVYGNVLMESEETTRLLREFRSVLRQDMKEREQLEHLAGSLNMALSLIQLRSLKTYQDKDE